MGSRGAVVELEKTIKKSSEEGRRGDHLGVSGVVSPKLCRGMWEGRMLGSACLGRSVSEGLG